MTKGEAMLELFHSLLPKKRSFVTRYTQHMEGYWGDLAYDSIREWHYYVLEVAVGKPFAAAFEAWMEGCWAAVKDDKPFKVDGRSFDCRAEDAFRDFHYAFQAE